MNVNPASFNQIFNGGNANQTCKAISLLKINKSVQESFRCPPATQVTLLG